MVARSQAKLDKAKQELLKEFPSIKAETVLFDFSKHIEIKDYEEQIVNKIKHLEKNRYETRAFAYLDIISWVESKVYEKPMREIVYEKYLSSRHRLQPQL